jgi:hypothetical protein
MSAVQLLDIKRQFLPTSGILATPKLAVSLDDVHFPKPETLCNRATRRFFAVQNSAQVSAINAGVPRKGALTTLALNCDSQQINNVIVVKYTDLRLAKPDKLRNRGAHNSPAGQNCV